MTPGFIRASYFEHTQLYGMRYKHDTVEVRLFLFDNGANGANGRPFSSMRVER